MTNILTVKGELLAREAKILTERVQESLLNDMDDAAATDCLESVFQRIKMLAEAGNHELFYEQASMDPRVLAVVLKYLGFCGYKVVEPQGKNDHSSATGSTLIGGIVRWANEMPSLSHTAEYPVPVGTVTHADTRPRLRSAIPPTR